MGFWIQETGISQVELSLMSNGDEVAFWYLSPPHPPKTEAINLPTDAAYFNIFRGAEPECFHCLIWIFDSGSK